MEAIAPDTIPPIFVAGSMATINASSLQLVPKFAARTISLTKPIAFEMIVNIIMEIVPVAMLWGFESVVFILLMWFFKGSVLSHKCFCLLYQEND